MKVFVWQRIDKCTSSYHSEGGVVVFAENEKAARDLANQIPGCVIDDDETPDYIYEDQAEEKVFIFPDAGCC